MIHIFHKWDKWGKPFIEHWYRQNKIGGYPIDDPVRFIKEVQERVCEKCGTIQRKEIPKT
jgi:hypothetical protein